MWITCGKQITNKLGNSDKKDYLSKVNMTKQKPNVMKETLEAIREMLDIIHDMPDLQPSEEIAMGLNLIHDSLHKLETLITISIIQKQN